MEIRYHQASPLGDGAGYALAAAVSGAEQLVFVSGQVPETAAGQVPAGFRDQARLAWRNVEHVLQDCALSLGNLVKVTTYLSDRAYRQANAEVRREVLGDLEPALTVIITGIYDERWLLEIEAVAAA